MAPVKDLAGRILTGQMHFGLAQLKMRSAVLGELVELLDSASAIIILYDSDDKIVFWNRGAELKYQWTKEEAIGSSWRALLKTQFACEYNFIMDALLTVGKWEGEMRQQRKDGVSLTIAASLVLRRDESRNPLAVLCIANDISEGSRMELALARSEANFRGLVENDLVGVYRTMQSGEVVYANTALAEMFGFDSVEELCARPAGERYVDPDVRQKLIDMLKEKGRISNFEFDGVTREGRTRCYLMSAVRNGDEIAGMVQDITGRKAIEKRLVESEKKYREFVESSPEGIGVNVGGKIAFVNPAAASMLGGSREALLGMTMMDFVPERLREEFGEQMKAVIDEGKNFSQLPEKFLRMDGTEIDVELSAAPVVFNTMPGIQIIFHDVTPRKRLEVEREQAQISLRQNWERMRGILENMPIMMIAVDGNGRVAVWNKECERVTGYPAGDIVNNPRAFELLYPEPEQRAIFFEKWNRKNSHFRDWEFEIGGKDGSRRVVSWSNISGEFPVRGWRIWAFGVDITERKLAEDKLYLAHRQLMDMIEFLPDATFVINQEKKVMAWNQAMESLTAISKADIIGKGEYCYALPFYGKPQPMLIDMLGLETQEIAMRFGEVKKVDSTLYAERYMPSAWGGKGAFLLFKATPLFDKNGAIVGGIETMRDISEHKQSEAILKKDKESFERLLKEKTRQLLKVQAELADARHLSEIGTLAATVAHELRNPLAAIRMGAYNLGRKIGNNALQAHIGTIEKKIIESDQIINNLLNYSKIKTPMCEYVRLGEIIVEAINSAAARFDGWDVGVKLDNKFGATIIFVDPLQFKEMVGNILANAYESLSEKHGDIAIKVKCAGNAVAISIADNGMGISQENLRKISRPFFTTKSKGTGLGLAVCKQMAAMHGGKISFKSRVGAGTTVTLTLPLKKGRES